MEDQRLLYKLITDVSTGLEDDNCPGLSDELTIQPAMGIRTNTREDYVLPINRLPSIPHFSPNSTPDPSPHTCSMPTPPPLHLSKRKRSTIPPSKLKGHPHKWSKQGVGEGEKVAPIKIWPTHFYVSEVAAGLDAIQKGRHQSGNTIKKLFKEEFHQDIVPSTFKCNRTLWNEQIPNALKTRFVSYGRTHRGLWTNLLYAYHHNGTKCVPQNTASDSGSADDDQSDVESTADLEMDIRSVTQTTNPYSSSPSPFIATPSLVRPVATPSTPTPLRPAATPSTPKPSPSPVIPAAPLKPAAINSPQPNICNFCTQPLPATLLSALNKLLSELMRPGHSYPSPTEECPSARDHHPGRGWQLRLQFCGLHTWESEVYAGSKVAAEMWPKSSDIDFVKLGYRIQIIRYSVM